MSDFAAPRRGIPSSASGARSRAGRCRTTPSSLHRVPGRGAGYDDHHRDRPFMGAVSERRPVELGLVAAHDSRPWLRTSHVGHRPGDRDSAARTSDIPPAVAATVYLLRQRSRGADGRRPTAHPHADASSDLPDDDRTALVDRHAGRRSHQLGAFRHRLVRRRTDREGVEVQQVERGSPRPDRGGCARLLRRGPRPVCARAEELRLLRLKSRDAGVLQRLWVRVPEAGA